MKSIRVFLADDDATRLTAEAAAAGLSLSSYLRWLLCGMKALPGPSQPLTALEGPSRPWTQPIETPSVAVVGATEPEDRAAFLSLSLKPSDPDPERAIPGVGGPATATATVQGHSAPAKPKRAPRAKPKSLGACPTCEVGAVVAKKRRSDGAPFHGCSRWPHCQWTGEVEPVVQALPFASARASPPSNLCARCSARPWGLTVDDGRMKVCDPCADAWHAEQRELDRAEQDRRAGISPRRTA